MTCPASNLRRTLLPSRPIFPSTDVPTQIRAKYTTASQDVINSLSGFRKSMMDQLSYSKSLSSRLQVVKNTIYNVSQYQKSIEKEILQLTTDLRNMGPTWVS